MYQLNDIIASIGGFGQGQCGLLFLATWTCIVAATNHISIIFLGATPPFRCEADDAGQDDFLNQCWKDNASNVACQEFVFEKTEFISTLVTKWNLVCDQVYLLPIIQGTYFGGVIAGNLLGGPLSDMIGRRPTLLGFTAVLLVFAHSLAFIDNYWLYLTARFMVGGAAHAIFAVMSVVILEIVPISYRSFSMAVLQVGWILGNVCLAGLGYLFRDETFFQVAIAVINVPLVAIFFVLPESPRWLLATGKLPEAKKSYQTLAKWNRVKSMEPFEKLWSEVVSHHGDQEQVTLATHMKATREQFEMIMSNGLARRRFILSLYPWFISGLAYYGIFLSVKFVHVNKYLLVAITLFTEVPVLIFINLIVNKVGRVVILMSSYIICGTLGVALLATDSSHVWLQPALVIAGKAVATIFWLCCGLHTSELFPTKARNAAFCFLDASSKFGAAISPFLVDLLAMWYEVLPNVVIGLLTILAAIPFLFLPETQGEDVPHNLEDMSKMDKTMIKRLLQNNSQNGQ